MSESALEPDSPTPGVPEPATFGLFYGWWIVAGSFCVQFVMMGTTFYAYGVLLKPLSEDLDVSRFAVGLGLPMMMLVGAIGGPLIGREAKSSIGATASATAERAPSTTPLWVRPNSISAIAAVINRSRAERWIHAFTGAASFKTMLGLRVTRSS